MAEARVAADMLMLMLVVVVVAVPRLAAVVANVQGQRESPQCSRAVAMTAITNLLSPPSARIVAA